MARSIKVLHNRAQPALGFQASRPHAGPGQGLSCCLRGTFETNRPTMAPWWEQLPPPAHRRWGHQTNVDCSNGADQRGGIATAVSTFFPAGQSQKIRSCRYEPFRGAKTGFLLQVRGSFSFHFVPNCSFFAQFQEKNEASWPPSAAGGDPAAAPDCAARSCTFLCAVWRTPGRLAVQSACHVATPETRRSRETRGKGPTSPAPVTRKHSLDLFGIVAREKAVTAGSYVSILCRSPSKRSACSSLLSTSCIRTRPRTNRSFHERFVASHLS